MQPSAAHQLPVTLDNREPEPGPDDEVFPFLIQPVVNQLLDALAIKAFLNVSRHPVSDLRQFEVLTVGLFVSEMSSLAFGRVVVLQDLQIGRALQRAQLALDEQGRDVDAQAYAGREDCYGGKVPVHDTLAGGCWGGIVSRNSARVRIELRYEYSSASKLIWIDSRSSSSSMNRNISRESSPMSLIMSAVSESSAANPETHFTLSIICLMAVMVPIIVASSRLIQYPCTDPCPHIDRCTRSTRKSSWPSLHPKPG